MFYFFYNMQNYKTKTNKMKNTIIFTLFIVISLNIIAQNTDYHWFEKDGKLFYNRNMPVYLWVSTSPDDNSKDIRMQSQSTKQYTNPMYFDSEGYNTIQYAYAVDTTTKKIAYPQQHVSFKVYVDGYEPRTNVYFKGVRRYYSNGLPVYKPDLEVQITAKDYMSGVNKILYSVNDENFSEYKSPISFAETGEFKLQYFAVDNTGNKSRIKKYRFIVK